MTSRLRFPGLVDLPDVPLEESRSPIVPFTGVYPESAWSEPTAWAPRPDLYQTPGCDPSEIEVLDMLWAIVRACKPELIVETGTSWGGGAMALGRACRHNGFGRVVTIECREKTAEAAREFLALDGLLGTGVGQVEVVVGNSLEYVPPEPIGMLFSDSDLGIRGEEILRLRPFMTRPRIVAIHDAIKHVALMPGIDELPWAERWTVPTPRGLVVGRLLP